MTTTAAPTSTPYRPSAAKRHTPYNSTALPTAMKTHATATANAPWGCAPAYS